MCAGCWSVCACCALNVNEVEACDTKSCCVANAFPATASEATATAARVASLRVRFMPFLSDLQLVCGDYDAFHPIRLALGGNWFLQNRQAERHAPDRGHGVLANGVQVDEVQRILDGRSGADGHAK